MTRSAVAANIVATGIVVGVLGFGGYLALANIDVRNQNVELRAELNAAQSNGEALYEQLLAEGLNPVAEAPDEVAASPTQGVPGVDGRDGRTPTVGELGAAVAAYCAARAGCVGEPGGVGPVGPAGAPGESVTGPSGPAGESITGPPGSDGANGTDGAPGSAGANGTDGRGVATIECVATDPATTVTRYTLTDGTSFDIRTDCQPAPTD